MAYRRTHATRADLEVLPEHLVGEIIGDELIVSPRPGPRHTVAASALGAELGGPFQRGRGGPGGWWILDEPELHLGRDIVVPDLAGWRRSRLPKMPETAWFDVTPDWVSEVLSPSTAPLDRGRKLDIYCRERVPHVWLLDPGVRTVEALRFEDRRWIVVGGAGGNDKVRLEPFGDLELDLAALWPEAAPER